MKKQLTPFMNEVCLEWRLYDHKNRLCNMFYEQLPWREMWSTWAYEIDSRDPACVLDQLIVTHWLYHFISQLITWILAGKNTLSIDREADVFGNCYMTFLNIHNIKQKNCILWLLTTQTKMILILISLGLRSIPTSSNLNV